MNDDLPSLEPTGDTTDNGMASLTNVSAPVLSDNVQTDRARRADFAMGDKSPGVQPLKDAFQTGQEPQVRQMAAGQANAEFQQQKLDKIKEITSSGAPITGDTLATLMSIGKAPEANPETVIEDKWAKNFVQTGVIGDPEKNLVFQSAYDKQPDDTNRQTQVATAVTSRNMQAKNFLEEAQGQYDQLPWVSTNTPDQQDKLGDLTKNLLGMGFRSYVLQRNLINQSPNNSFLPGSNKLEQIQSLYLLPQDQFLPALKAAAGPQSQLWKDSPGAALDFIKAAVSFSTSDAYVDNVFAVGNTAAILPFGSAARAIGRLAGGREVQSLALTTAQKAAEDVLKGSPKPPSTPLGSATSTAEDILRSPSTPVEKLYIPSAAVKRDWESVGRFGTVKVIDGKPTYFTNDGAAVNLLRSPEEGAVPVSVSKGETTNTFTTKQGTFEHTPEGTILNHGEEPTKTIYVDAKGAAKLSKITDKEGHLLLEGEDGKYFVGSREDGKAVPGTKTAVQTEPARGLYPVHIPIEDSQAPPIFGQKISRVDTAVNQKVTFGKAYVAPKEQVEARTALADIVKAAGEDHPVDALSKMGQHERAAEVHATSTLNDHIQEIVHTGDVEAIKRAIPSLTSPQTFFHNSASLSVQRANRLADEAGRQVMDIGLAMKDPARVERMTQDALMKDVQSVKDQVKTRYNRGSDAILDQKHYWDGQSNVYYVETRFGKKDGTLFDSSASATYARNMQYRLGKSATVEQEGNQFYLSHLQHIDETFRAGRDGLIVAENTTPQGFWHSLVNAATGKLFGAGTSIRSARYNLGDLQNSNRVVATHAPSVLKDAIEKTAKTMGDFSKTERHEMERMLEANRDFMHDNGDRGIFYKTAAEFENAFNDLHGFMPSDKQIAAYDSFVRLSDLDWLLRAMQMHRDKARMGIRNYRVPIPSTDEVGLPTGTKTGWFNAKEVPDLLPHMTQDANVYVAPEGRFTTKFNKTVNDDILRAKIKSGEYKVLQVANPREKPLLETTGIKDDVHFIVSDAMEDKVLQMGEGMPYNPGGHVIYQDPYFMKMPIVGPGTKGRQTHFGDISIKTFATRKEGEQWVDLYNQAKDHLHNNREAELQSMFDRGLFPETLPEFKQWFTNGSFGAETKHPFVLTTAGRDTFQSSPALTKQYPGLHEQYTSYNLSQNWNKEFLADRDQQLNTIAKQGTDANPVYVNVPSKLYDPYTSLQKGIAQIVRERWMGDYKTSAAESWIQEFWHLFPQSTLPREKLGQNPLYWLYHAAGNMDSGIAKTQPELFTAAMTSRQNILNFVGARDEVGSVLNGLEKRAIDWLAPKIGAKAAGKIEETILPAIKNIPMYTRAAVFNAVDGMFNPVQLFQQAQGIVHVLALSPTNGLKGASASALAHFLRGTEDGAILDNFAGKASNLGWNADHFKEAVTAWKSTGVHNIGGEVALLNRIADPQLFQSGVGSFLDKGRYFFKKGESIVRDNAFFTSYQDWRTANPTATFDNRALGDVMNRFDTLSMNMTRASNAAYNEGVASIPTQFFTWNARFMEQMVGKQLTIGEKMRAMAMYSAVYGIPATLGGITFGLVPYANYDDIRGYALANGINVHNKFYQALSEGIPAMLTNLISGHETDFQRFSPEGNQIKDLLDGKKDVYKTLVGASGQWIGTLGNTLYPFGKFAWSALHGKPNEFPLKWNDVLNVAENVSSFNNGEKLAVALATGKLYTRSDQAIDSNLDTFESMMLGLGLPPKQDTDLFKRFDYLKELKNAQEKLKPLMLQEWRNAFTAIGKGDMQGMVDHMTRVKSYATMGDLSLQDEADLYSQALNGHADLIDQAERQWQEKLPQLRTIPAMKQYFENLKQKQ